MKAQVQVFLRVCLCKVPVSLGVFEQWYRVTNSEHGELRARYALVED